MDKKTVAFILIAVGLLAITAGVILFLKGSPKEDDQNQINGV